MGRILRNIVKFFVIVVCVFLIGYVLMFYKNITEIFSSLKQRENTKYIVIHHIGVPDASVIEVDGYHRNSKKWGSGFAYHFLITKKGRVIQVHNLNSETGHAFEYNSNSIAIAIEGDYNNEELTLIQQVNLIILTKTLILKYGLKAENVKGHGELLNTDCPGSNINLKGLREWL